MGKAELLGTCVLILFGTSVVAAIQVHPDQSTLYSTGLYINAVWGVGVCMGVLVAFDVSGAHLNPSVRLSAWIDSKLSTRKAICFATAQLVGAFCGALLTTLNYVVFRGGSHLRNFYCTAPLDGASAASWSNAFLNEIMATAVLIIGFSGITSSRCSKFQVAGFGGALIVGIGGAFGQITGYAMNPARDLGARICFLLFTVLYGKAGVWEDVMGAGYFWVPLVAPLCGAALGNKCWQVMIVGTAHKQEEEVK